MSVIRVLIIEDEEEIAKLLQRFLRQSGLEVDHEADGKDGLERFLYTEEPYDVLLVDGLLPRKTGFEIADAVRASKRGDKVGMIMMSAAFRSGSSRREALHAGFDEFYAKPFVVGQLMQTVFDLAKKRAGKNPPPAAASRKSRARISRQAREAAHGSSVEKTGSGPSKSSPAIFASAAAADSKPNLPSSPGSVVTMSAERAVIDRPEAAPRFLIETARAERTGMARFSDGVAKLEIAFLHGVAVGAWDNFRENRFGERLLRLGVLTESEVAEVDARMRERRERFAEAAIALGCLNEDTALEAMDGQATDRLSKAVSFSSGEVVFAEDEAAVERAAGTPMDLMETILHRFLEHSSPRLLDRLRGDLDGAALEPTQDFEPGLVAFARLRPASALPGQFFVGGRALPEVLVTSENTGEEMVAMRMAGMLRTPKEPVTRKNIPHHLRLHDGTTEVDTALSRRVRGALLRARGRNLYDFLSVERLADRFAVEAGVRRLEAEFGREVVDLKKLGPARDAARELWARLEEARSTLLDDERRATYDANLEWDDAPVLGDEAEEKFLEGRVALSKKEFPIARAAFAKAATARPDDVELVAFHGWATVLDPAVARTVGVKILEGAHLLNPQAMRPLFFLGLAAAQDGDRERAAALLRQARALGPDNREVLSALAAVGADL